MTKWFFPIGIFFFSFSSFSQTVEIKTSGGRLNIRQDASVTSKSCGKVRNGQKLEKVSEKDGWIQVKINQRGCPPTVWIHGYYTAEHYDGPRTTNELKTWSLPQPNGAGFLSGTIVDEPLSLPDNVPTPTSRPSQTADSELGESVSSSTVAVASSIAGESSPQRPEGLSDSDAQLCEFFDHDRKVLDRTRTENCYQLMKKANAGEIPKNALLYSLRYLKANMNELKDRRCLARGGPNGIQNGCQFVMNDLNKRVSGFPNRSPSYFIDLCHGTDNSSNKGLVYKTYINRGTGSSNNSYADRGGRRTTVPGAFLTGALTPFIPYRVTQAYRNIGWNNCFQKDSRGRPRVNRPVQDISRCPVTRLALYGAQSSNNSTSASKPMHVSPYKSSWGCPSIKADERWIMSELHKRGPSLVINYGPQKYHNDSSVNNCRND